MIHKYIFSLLLTTSFSYCVVAAPSKILLEESSSKDKENTTTSSTSSLTEEQKSQLDFIKNLKEMLYKSTENLPPETFTDLKRKELKILTDLFITQIQQSQKNNQELNIPSLLEQTLKIREDQLAKEHPKVFKPYKTHIEAFAWVAHSLQGIGIMTADLEKKDKITLVDNLLNIMFDITDAKKYKSKISPEERKERIQILEQYDNIKAADKNTNINEQLGSIARENLERLRRQDLKLFEKLDLFQFFPRYVLTIIENLDRLSS
jgi:hypothetical protein